MSGRIAFWAIALSMSAFPFSGTTISGRFIGGQGSALGGQDAYMIAFTESSADFRIVILGYVHPDEQGKWSISGLPAEGKIHLAGFHLKHQLSMFYQEISLTGKPVADLGIQQAGDHPLGIELPPGSGVSGPPSLPRLFRNRQNHQIAGELLKLALERQEPASRPSQKNDSTIDGIWMRSARVYQISGDKATIIDAGSKLNTSVVAGEEVMRNITRTGEYTWSAEVLWQLDSEKKWAAGSLVLSPDGQTLTRLSISPWAETPEVVVFTRK